MGHTYNLIHAVDGTGRNTNRPGRDQVVSSTFSDRPEFFSTSTVVRIPALTPTKSRDMASKQTIGPCVILDFSRKLECIKAWFSDTGQLLESRLGELDDLLARLILLEIAASELESAIFRTGARPDSIQGILIYSSSSPLWRPSLLEPWTHRYCYTPYLGRDALSYAEELGLTFIGTDGLRLEDPIANFADTERPFQETDASVVEAKQSISVMARASIAHWRERPLSIQALGAGVALYQNLNIPDNLKGAIGVFRNIPQIVPVGDFNAHVPANAHFEP